VKRDRRAAAILVGLAAFACRGEETKRAEGASASSAVSSTAPPIASAVPSATPPWDAGKPPPAVPEGMVWIPPGALVAGTPAGVLPRIADQEMPGEQVVLRGFFMSIYPYPNEEAAIPLSNVTQVQANGLCEARGQRLCTELEWERACKGPDNHTYEYGDRYRPEVCGTGAEPRMLPSGLRVACRSDFGVRDLHGSLWEWTSSPWGRGSREGLVTLRGGNAASGEIAGRCANASSRAPGTSSRSVGFRCCMGPRNDAEVQLRVERRTPLEIRNFDGDSIVEAALAALPEDARAELRRPDDFRISHGWLWHPIGNEELIVLGGCTTEVVQRGCGAIVLRRTQNGPEALGWAGSSRFQPTVRVEPDPRYLWVYGGDERSHFRRLLRYGYGRVTRGETQRNVKNPK
jgi:sulfatase modifying factor 1